MTAEETAAPPTTPLCFLERARPFKTPSKRHPPVGTMAPFAPRNYEKSLLFASLLSLSLSLPLSFSLSLSLSLPLCLSLSLSPEIYIFDPDVIQPQIRERRTCTVRGCYANARFTSSVVSGHALRRDYWVHGASAPLASPSRTVHAATSPSAAALCCSAPERRYRRVCVCVCRAYRYAGGSEQRRRYRMKGKRERQRERDRERKRKKRVCVRV